MEGLGGFGLPVAIAGSVYFLYRGDYRTAACFVVGGFASAASFTTGIRNRTGFHQITRTVFVAAGSFLAGIAGRKIYERDENNNFCKRVIK